MVTQRRAQMVLLSAQGVDVPAIAKVAFTSEDQVRDVIRNFNADGFSSLYPKYQDGHPPKFIHDLSFSWSLDGLADFLVAKAAVDDISHDPRDQPTGPRAVTRNWPLHTDSNRGSL